MRPNCSPWPCLHALHAQWHQPDQRAAALFESAQSFSNLYYHNLPDVWSEKKLCFLQHVAFMYDSWFLGFSLKCLLLDCFTRSPSLMSVSCTTAIEQRRHSCQNEKEKSHLSLAFCLGLCNPHHLLPSPPPYLPPQHTMTAGSAFECGFGSLTLSRCVIICSSFDLSCLNQVKWAVTLWSHNCFLLSLSQYLFKSEDALWTERPVFHSCDYWGCSFTWN